ncbi:unnamed protein product [Lactuca virosa]|uniref:Uncharacterized protein n=1 Tax=Lactuca virosa TaxID=75947 RepID=A0AAU9NG02_9ASTR|nr:unnamed protein product [Lactuca virosa]
MEDTTTFTTVFSLKRLMDGQSKTTTGHTYHHKSASHHRLCCCHQTFKVDLEQNPKFELNLQPRDIEKLLLTSFTVRSLLFERKFGKYANGHVAPVDSGPEK